MKETPIPCRMSCQTINFKRPLLPVPVAPMMCLWVAIWELSRVM